MRRASIAAACVAGLGLGPGALAAPLAFDVREGRNVNSFYRDGPVAAHVVLRSGADPRILAAFPAGDSGVGVWFAPVAKPASWSLVGETQAATGTDPRGRALYGVTAKASVTVPELAVRQVLLSSVRVLRDYQQYGTYPAEVATDPVVSGDDVTWARDRLDGAAGYRFSLDLTDGAWRDGRLVAGADGAIAFSMTALTGETPLTPLADGALLADPEAGDPAARQTLSFLSYKEKYLAGSWRFDTYFGRDTMMSVRLLMPALTPGAVEAGLRSVLARLADDGEAAHEEDVGELAVLDHMRRDETRSDAPLFDYRMVDSAFMVPLVAASWLLDDPRGRAAAAVLLAADDGRTWQAPRAMGADLVANCRFVARSAAPFAADPGVARLIGLKPGIRAGEWRDSDNGIARGHYPFDVNAVFVPEALDAIDRLSRSGLLDAYMTDADRALFGQTAAMALVWRARARTLFEMEIPNGMAREAVAAYAASLGVADTSASLGDGPTRFHAISLSADGTPIPVMHSDDGFDLLFGYPSPDQLDEIVETITRPFPAGLMTDVGVVVANPVFARPELRVAMDNHAYHGTVIWSWQHAVLAAGLDRQLARSDLPAATASRLRAAREAVWRAIDAGHAVSNSELWSWAYDGKRFRVEPFGASGGDADESDAAQLWSTAFLALRPPAP